MPNCFGNQKGITDLLRLISSLSQAVLGSSRFGGWSCDDVACGKPLCWRLLLQAFSELLPSVHTLKTALQLGNCLSCPEGPSRAKTQGPPRVGKTLEAKQCFGWYLLCDLPLLIPKCHWCIVYKLFLLSSQAKTTGMGPGHHWRPLQPGRWREHTESTHMDVIKNKHEGKISVMSKVVTDFLYLPGFLLLYPQQTSNCLSVFLRGPLLLPTLLHS